MPCSAAITNITLLCRNAPHGCTCCAPGSVFCAYCSTHTSTRAASSKANRERRWLVDDDKLGCFCDDVDGAADHRRLVPVERVCDEVVLAQHRVGHGLAVDAHAPGRDLLLVELARQPKLARPHVEQPLAKPALLGVHAVRVVVRHHTPQPVAQLVRGLGQHLCGHHARLCHALDSKSARAASTTHSTAWPPHRAVSQRARERKSKTTCGANLDLRGTDLTSPLAAALLAALLCSRCAWGGVCELCSADCGRWPLRGRERRRSWRGRRLGHAEVDKLMQRGF